ncbi:MAG: Ig-like domain-containing protein [Janthinobacterium lividum]
MLLSPFRTAAALFFLLLTLTSTAQPSYASGQGSIGVSAAPDVIYSDGKSSTVITATVQDSGGHPAPDGTSVRFTTTLGTLTPDTASTTSGVARVSLTSVSTPGTAKVTAAAFGGGMEGAPASTASVEFTADRESLFNKDARWIRVDCPQYLIYSADTHIIEADGKNRSAHLDYKSLDITADSLQVDLKTQTVLARGAVLQRGRHTMRASEVRYDLLTASGTAILADTAEAVTVTGLDLETMQQPVDVTQLPMLNNPYRFVDLSSSRVVVSARAITADPNDQIQFRRATIYSDGRKLLSVMYHVMPMNTDQIFGQQLVGVGSAGVYLNVPFYYNVTTHSRGTIYLRNAAVNGANIGNSLTIGASFFNTQAAPHGMALDLEQSYDAGRNGSGQLLVSGLTRADWGAQWTHTQRFDEQTSSYFLVDFPEHRSLYASSNLSHQFNGFSFNVSASGSRDPGDSGYSASSMTLNTYLQTNPHMLGHSGVNYTTDLGIEHGQLTESSPETGRVVTPVSTTSATMRFYTAPMHLDRRTQLTDSISVGQAWGGVNNSFAPTVAANLGLSRTFRKSDTLSLNYTFSYDPLLSQLGTSSSGLNPLQALLQSTTQHRLTAIYSAALFPRVNVSFSGSYGLPLNDRSLFSTVSYRINNDWGVGLAESFERYITDTYQDVEYSVSRRILGRNLTFYYSTRTKKVNFDFAGLGWQ